MINLKPITVGILLSLSSTAMAFEGAYDSVTYRQFDQVCNNNGPMALKLCQYYLNGSIDSLRHITKSPIVSKAMNSCPERFSWEGALEVYKQLLDSDVADKVNAPLGIMLIYLKTTACGLGDNNDLVKKE